MKARFVSLLMLAATPAAVALELPVDASHSAVVFSWNHFGFSHPVARLEQINGSVVLDEADLTRSSVTVKLPLDGLRTGDAKLDERLKKDEFLDAARYPNIEFKSTRVVKTGPNELEITGNLSIHGVTRPVVLKTRINLITKDPISKVPKAGFDADLILRRSDFGVSKYVPAVTDELLVHITLDAHRED
jgi:polyisoprenoid-binding protein YceI